MVIWYQRIARYVEFMIFLNCQVKLLVHHWITKFSFHGYFQKNHLLTDLRWNAT